MNILHQLDKNLQTECFYLRYEIERFKSQVSFASQFIELIPERKAEFQELINEAVISINKIEKLTDYENVKSTVRNAEKIMDPIGKVAKSYKIHCVGHAHIDMNWQWGWPETVATVCDTFTTVLKLMDEIPEFRFSQSQAAVYKILQDYRPDILEQVKEKVKEGRWEVTANHWVEGDKNLIRGEGLTRHLLYSAAYMNELFGLDPSDMPVEWAPDTFGHSLMVPAYLNAGGIKYSYLHRPGHMLKQKYKAFWWKSPDNSKVLVRNDCSEGYNGIISPEISHKMLDFVKETQGHDYMFVYGVGDHGGGPTRCDLKKIEDMSKWPIFPDIKFSSAKVFFEQLESECAEHLPVVDHELNVEFTGCYTSQSQIKKANRVSENRLYDTELAAVLAWKSCDYGYPNSKIEKSWKNCLFNHFHDILPGSGVTATRQYTMGLYQDIMAETSMIESFSLRKFAAEVNTSSLIKDNFQESIPSFYYKDSFGAGSGIGSVDGSISLAEQADGRKIRPFVLFNSSSAKRSEVMELFIWDNPNPGPDAEIKKRSYSVITPDGQQIPVQTAGDGYEWGHYYVKILFPVDQNPMSYALYTVIEDNDIPDFKPSLKKIQNDHHCSYSLHERSMRFGAENDSIFFEVSPKTGGIKRLYDKKAQKDIISPSKQLEPLEYSLERVQDMSSWLINHANKNDKFIIDNITYLDKGPYRISIEVKLKIFDSAFSVIYELNHNSPQVNIHIKGNWLETGSQEKGCPALRLPFTFNYKRPQITSEIPFGSLKRNFDSDEELPTLQWLKIMDSDNKTGCLLLNDSKYGYAVDANSVRISLIRSSFEPDPFPEIGQHEAYFALVPFSENISNTEATQAGQAFNTPIKSVGTSVHSGNLPTSGNIIKISDSNVVLSGIKKSEKADKVIIRLYETEGITNTIKLEIAENLFGKINSATLVDLYERPLSERQLKVDGNYIKIDVAPYKIISLEIEFCE